MLAFNVLRYFIAIFNSLKQEYCTPKHRLMKTFLPSVKPSYSQTNLPGTKSYRKLIFLFIAFTCSFGRFAAAQVTVAGSAGANGTYTSLTNAGGAFAAINANNQAGRNITISITANIATEAGTNALTGGAGMWTTLTITPSGTRTVSGTRNGVLFDLSGADNVTINGLNSGGNSLSFSNTSTNTSAATFRFINDATNNTITNCTILGSSTGNGTGTIFFSTRGSGNGNDNNTISSCNITAAGANLPTNAIFAWGTTSSTARMNSTVSITGNNIYDFFNATASCNGIYIYEGNIDWTISNNRIYQTASRTFTTTALRYTGIRIDDNSLLGSTYHTISGNVIGFANSAGTGTTTITGSSNEFRGIEIVSASSATATSIQGNTISGINQTTSRASTNTINSCFIGIMCGSAAVGKFNVGTTTGNTIGDLAGSSTIVINESSTTANTAPAIAIMDFGNASNSISNNNIGSITVQGAGTTVGFRAIYVYTTTGLTETITNNTIGGGSAPIAMQHTGSYVNYLIECRQANGTITGNVIQNVSSKANTATTVVLSGITVSGSTGNNTISQNIIHTLSNNPGSSDAAVYAMDLSFPTGTTNTVDRNSIHSLNTLSSTSSQITGIQARAGRATYKNNIIRLGIDASGSSITLGCQIVGIFHGSTTANNNFYNNSIYIGGTGVVASGTTVCLYGGGVTTVARSYVNNILYNARSNASGTAPNIALYPGGTGVNPAGLTSDYNDLYTSGMYGYLGAYNGFGYTSLSSFAAATGKDGNSVSGFPSFVNATGNAGSVDLNIQVGSICNNEGSYLAAVPTDYLGVARDVIIPDIGAYEIARGIAPGSWIGVTSTDWNTASNWDNLTVPTTAVDVYIAGGHPNFPVIPTGISANTKNLTLHKSNSSLSVTGNGQLSIAGSIASVGIFNVSDGTVEMIGSSAQTIPNNAFVNNQVKNLIISNTDATPGGGVTLADTVEVLRSLTFGAGGRNINTGGFLILRSTSTQTAWVGQMSATNTITGNVGVERYIPLHSKAWQFLATPITTSSTQTVKQAWQEGSSSANSNPNPGYGTQLTSSRSDAVTHPTPGFDAYTPTGASIKVYNKASGGYVALNRTDTAIANPKGYMVLVRGDRSVTTFGASPTATVLRTKGTLYTPASPPATVVLSTPGFESVGNPYASAIDFRQLGFTGGVQTDFFYLWDPKLTTIGINSAYGLGGFQSFSWNSGTSSWDVTPGGGSYSGSNRYIESGQAFFINAPFSAGTLSFSESAKVSGSNDVNRVTVVSQLKQFRTNLYVIRPEGNVLLDGNRVRFDRSYSNDVDVNDAVKLNNSSENFGISRNGKTLVIESRRPAAENDVINYKMGQVRVQQYELEFIPENMNAGGLQAFLEDKFLRRSYPVSLEATTRIRFSIENIPGSYAEDRFRLVFRNPNRQELAKGSEKIVATPKPVVETVSEVKPATINRKIASTGIRVFPNPVTDKTIHLQFSNQQEGNYVVKLVSKLGQELYNDVINISAGNKANHTIKLESFITDGTYLLIIKKPDGNTVTEQVLIK